MNLMIKSQILHLIIVGLLDYCTAHDGWNVTGYQGLFYPSNKPSCARLPGGVQLVETGGRRVFIVKSGHF